MPYLIQNMRDLHIRVKGLEKKNDDRDKKDEKQKEEDTTVNPFMGIGATLNQPQLTVGSGFGNQNYNTTGQFNNMGGGINSGFMGNSGGFYWNV